MRAADYRRSRDPQTSARPMLGESPVDPAAISRRLALTAIL
jgi:hypothetical protein